jgi:hypothetical protein
MVLSQLRAIGGDTISFVKALGRTEMSKTNQLFVDSRKGPYAGAVTLNCAGRQNTSSCTTLRPSTMPDRSLCDS